MECLSEQPLFVPLWSELRYTLFCGVFSGERTVSSVTRRRLPSETLTHTPCPRRFLGVLWGAYNTFKSLKSNSVPQKASQLQFWSVWSAWQLYNRYFEWGLSWVPLYYEAKLVLLIWLLLPESNAPPALFSRVLDPLVVLARTNIAPRAVSIILR